MLPVSSIQDYLSIRREEHHVAMVESARQGHSDDKRRLTQFNYSCIPGEDGLLRGCRTPSNSVGMDIDFDDADERKIKSTIRRIIRLREEIGLLLLERSVSKGLHLVFRRHEEMSQEDNLRWASDKIGVAYDKAAKDITRVFFATTGSESDLLYLHQDLFVNEPAKNVTPNDEPNDVEPKSEPKSELQADAANVGEREAQDAAPVDESGDADADEQDDYSLPYDEIIETWGRIKEPTFPNVPVGMRNTTLFTICNGLRYICEHNERKLQSLIWPKYSLGLERNEVEGIIRSALARERGLMPRDLKEVLHFKLLAREGGELSGSGAEGGAGEGAAGDNGGENGVALADVNAAEMCGVSSPYPSVARCIVDDMDLPTLPRWVDVLLTPVLPGYRYLTLCGSYTAMLTLLSDVRRKFGSKGVARLNGWTHWDGLSGSGKRQLREVIEALIKPLRAQDERTRNVINKVIEDNKTAKDGEKQKLPQLGLRILECDTTRKAHIQQMAYLDGKKTFTFAEEISSLNLNRQGYYYRGDFCRLMFDNGNVGSLNATGDSVTLQTPCNWDVTTSGTHDQTIKQWAKNLSDGSAQRVLICLVPDNTYQRLPVYRQYGEEDVAYIDRATSLMMKLSGLLLTPMLDRALEAWLERVRTELEALPIGQRNDERARFRFRSAEIAHTMGVTMQCAWIVQDILDMDDELMAKIEGIKAELDKAKSDISVSEDEIVALERRLIEARAEYDEFKVHALELDGYRERRAASDLAVRTAQYCLDVQDLLWSRRLRTEQLASYEGINLHAATGRPNETLDVLDRLPGKFTVAQACEALADKSKSAVKTIILRLIKAGLVRKAGTVNRIACYEKT